MTTRAQSNVVGVVLLLGIAVISLGVVTAGVGSVVDHAATSADANRVAGAFASAFRPTETTGVRTTRVPFGSGTLRTVRRNVSLRYWNDTVVANVTTRAVVFDAGDRRVTAVAGAIVEGGDGWARIRRGPPVTASATVLVVGLVDRRGAFRLGGDPGGTGVALRTNVSHERRSLPAGRYRLRIETTAPKAFARYYRDRTGVVAATRDFDGDGVPSVVVRFPRAKHVYLVTHHAGVALR